MKAKWLMLIGVPLLALLIGAWIGSQIPSPAARAAPNAPTDVCPASRLLTGSVQDYQGNPVMSGGTVEIVGWPITSTISPGGFYAIDISGLPVSDYYVVATWSTGRAIQLRPTSFWQGCLRDNLQLKLQECILVGYAYDCVGHPVPGARVELVGLESLSGDPHPNPAFTDARGAYTITISSTSPPLPPSPYQIVATYLDDLSVVRSDIPLECPRTQLNFAGEFCLPNYPCPRGRVLTGGVYDYLANPVADARVEIIGWPITGTTNISGTYAIDISGLPVSTYPVVARLSSGEIISKTQTIGFWYGCRNDDLVLDFRQSLLVGYAYDCSGNPVEGARVEILGWQTPAGDPHPNPALTDATGAYTITISSLPRGEYQIVATHPNGLFTQQETVLDGTQGGLTQLNFTGVFCLPGDLCPANRVLTGVIYDYLGHPVPDATVQVLGWPITATTNASGIYTISLSGLPISTYMVVARWPSGTAKRTLPASFWQGCFTDNLHLSLQESLLVGYAFDCDGYPVAGARIEILGWQTPPDDPHPNPALTDARGAYTITISSLQPGSYPVIAAHPNGPSIQQQANLDGTRGGLTQLNFTGVFCLPGITPTPTPTSIPGQCKQGTTLSGEVRDCQGHPVSGATVQIEGTPRKAITNALGRYTIDISGLPIRSYAVRVSKSGYADQVQTPPLSFWAACQNTNLSLDFTGAFCLPRLRVYVPVLNLVNEQAGYETWIQVQNLGQCDIVVSMDLYGEYSGDCEAGNLLRTLHSGDIRPGSTWVWTSAYLPSNARSAILYASQPIAVEVLRRGPGIPDSGVEVTGGYDGIPSTLLGKRDDFFGGYAYYAPVVYGFSDGLSSWLYIQNAGTRCTTVEIYFRSEANCNRTTIGNVRVLAPGEMVRFDVAGTVGGRFQGSAWISASQPLAIVVDHVGDNVLMSYIAMPADTLYADGGDIPFSVGSQVNYGPLIYREFQGWDTTVHVQNLGSTSQAKVKVYFLDASGDVIQTLVDWICPRGSQHFFLPVVNGLPGNYVGAVRVESQDWWSPGAPPVPYPAIVSVAELVKYEGPARAERLEAVAYNLFTENTAYDWQTGELGVKRVAIPSVIKGRGGLTSEVAIQNVVPLPGFTDLALSMYDANRLLDVHHEKLNEKQVEYINIESWALIPHNFEGSMIISATHWTHVLPGQPYTTTAGIAAVSVVRSGTILGEDIPGDESAGVEAIPMLAVAPACAPTTDVGIVTLECTGADEYVEVVNMGTTARDLTGWVILSVVGHQRFNFPSGYVLQPGASVRVHSGPAASSNPPTDLLWTRDYIWNNDGDEAELRDDADRLVDSRCCSAGCAASFTR